MEATIRGAGRPGAGDCPWDKIRPGKEKSAGIQKGGGPGDRNSAGMAEPAFFYVKVSVKRPEIIYAGAGHKKSSPAERNANQAIQAIAILAVTQEDTMWYVIQTTTGKEEELVAGIHAVLAGKGYRDCFVIKAEWLKRLGGTWRLQVCPLFPGYVFIETDSPGRIFQGLKQVPKYSKILGNGAFEFTAVEEEERRLLERLCGMGNEKEGKGKQGSRGNPENREAGQRWVVRLTEASVEEDGTVTFGKGPLTELKDFTELKKEIKEINEIKGTEQTDGETAKSGQAGGGKIRAVLHKRYAVADIRLLGKERTLMLGIRLKKDQGHII